MSVDQCSEICLSILAKELRHALSADSDTSWLAVDVGNSRIKVGLFDVSGSASESPRITESGSQVVHSAGLPECVGFHSSPLDESVDWDSVIEDHGTATSFRCVIVGSNQHGVDRVVAEWPKWLAKPVVMRSSKSLELDIQVDEPQRVGLDRLLNAAAANVVREAGQPAIIVDCGTATTVDLVSASGSFCGGAILPGFTLCARALNQYTEVLPLISMSELFDLPPSEDCHPALGSNTQAAIMSGVFWGQIGAVRELIVRLSRQQLPGRQQEFTIDGDDSRHKLLLTGGGARLLAPYFADAIHYPFLPLQGLVCAAASKQSLQGRRSLATDRES
jgi:type III pantothenate kinase